MTPASPIRSLPSASTALRAAAGAALLAGLGWLALRHVDLRAVRTIDVAWWWFTASLIANLLSIAGKSTAWKAALDAVPGARRVRYRQLVPALFVGFLLNTVLFARVGELARIAVLRRRLRKDGIDIPGSTIVGTVACENLVLGISLVGFLAVTAVLIGAPRSALIAIGVVGALLAAAAGGLYLLVRRSSTTAPSGSWVGRRLERASSFLEGFAQGQALLRNRRQLLRALGAGLLSWAAQVAGILWALAAFGVHLGLGAAALVFLTTTIVQLVPLLPGNVGIFQGAAAVALTKTYGVDAAHAVAFGFGLQVLEMSLGVGLGLIFLWREGLTFRQTRALARGAATA